MLKASELRDAIDAGYRDSNDTGHQRNAFPVRLSGISDCPRKTAAILCGVPRKDPTPQSLRVFELGHQRGGPLMHNLLRGIGDGWQGAFERSVYLETQIEGEEGQTLVDMAAEAFGPEDLPISVAIGNKLCIRGRCDLVMWHRDSPNHVIVVDAKTKNPFGFKKLDDEGPDKGYVAQLQAYAAGLQREGLHVDQCWLVYEDKATQEIKPIEVRVDSGHPMDSLANTVRQVELVLRTWADAVSLGNGNEDEVLDLVFAGVPALEALRGDIGGQVKPGPLPWQCNYCAIGPELGRCVEAGRLSNRSSAGRIPKWVVS